jgi:hypothetical protein
MADEIEYEALSPNAGFAVYPILSIFQEVCLNIPFTLGEHARRLAGTFPSLLSSPLSHFWNLMCRPESQSMQSCFL